MKNAAKRKTLRGDIFLFSLIRNRVVYRQNHYRECRDKSHYKSRYKSVLLFAKSADRAHGLSSVRRARFCQMHTAMHTAIPIIAGTVSRSLPFLIFAILCFLRFRHGNFYRSSASCAGCPPSLGLPVQLPRTSVLFSRWDVCLNASITSSVLFSAVRRLFFFFGIVVTSVILCRFFISISAERGQNNGSPP